MKRIFEDILDDIDLGDSEQNDVVSRLDNNNVVDWKQFEFAFTISVNLQKDLNWEIVTPKRVKEEFTEPFFRFKEKLNVYLDSYWTDDQLYCQKEEYVEQFKDTYDVKLLPEDWPVRLEFPQHGGYCVFFNFDGNIFHLLRFFDELWNLDCGIDICFGLYWLNAKNIDWKYNFIRDISIRNFLRDSDNQKYYVISKKSFEYQKLTDQIFNLFWNYCRNWRNQPKNRYLNLKEFNSDEERKQYILKSLMKYTDKFFNK